MGAGLFGLDGRVALVTGSSRGIGNALARALADAGATVVLNGIDENGSRPRKRRWPRTIRRAGSARAFDVTDAEAAAAGSPGWRRTSARWKSW